MELIIMNTGQEKNMNGDPHTWQDWIMHLKA